MHEKILDSVIGLTLENMKIFSIETQGLHTFIVIPLKELLKNMFYQKNMKSIGRIRISK